MPGPPPPPPPLALNLSAASSGNNQGRNLLLQSIRNGKPLKKTVTNDKSAPCVSGRVKGESSNVTSNENNSVSNTNSGGISAGNAAPMGLGGLFSSGMPKLKPTGLRATMCEKDSNSSINSNSMTNLSPSSTHTVKRGPPPVPPPATQKPQVFCPQVAESTNTADESTKSFGKPTLAPKPPPLPSGAPQKPSPPPKKLNLTSNASVSRAQSMRLPRSPPVLAPTPHSLHQSQDCLNENQSRPTNRILRPPVVRPPSPPTSKTSSNATVTRVAPPPPSRVTVIPPLTPPPPPPVAHRPPPTHQRLAPPPPPPPTPPTRSSSMRNGQTPNFVDLESRFGELFHSQSYFPPPEPFKGFQKTYSSRNAAKQQAPPPPMQSSPNPNSMHSLNLTSEGKQWQSNTTSLAC